MVVVEKSQPARFTCILSFSTYVLYIKRNLTHLPRKNIHTFSPSLSWHPTINCDAQRLNCDRGWSWLGWRTCTIPKRFASIDFKAWQIIINMHHKYVCNTCSLSTYMYLTLNDCSQRRHCDHWDDDSRASSAQMFRFTLGIVANRTSPNPNICVNLRPNKLDAARELLWRHKQRKHKNTAHHMVWGPPRGLYEKRGGWSKYILYTYPPPNVTSSTNTLSTPHSMVKGSLIS